MRPCTPLPCLQEDGETAGHKARRLRDRASDAAEDAADHVKRGWFGLKVGILGWGISFFERGRAWRCLGGHHTTRPEEKILCAANSFEASQLPDLRCLKLPQ